jgi:hypothetical protein
MPFGGFVGISCCHKKLPTKQIKIHIEWDLFWAGGAQRYTIICGPKRGKPGGVAS